MEQSYPPLPEHPLFNPVVYASFWDRFGAAFIDGINLAVAQFIIGLFVEEEGTDAILSTIISWLYYAIQESGPKQATFGKRVLGIKVTNLNGGRISFGQATGRYFGKILSTLILLIGYFMMLWDDKKQTLHDKLANTLVIKI